MFTCTFYTDTLRISLKAEDVTVRNLSRIFAVSRVGLLYGTDTDTRSVQEVAPPTFWLYKYIAK